MKVIIIGTSKISEELVDSFKKAGIEVYACVSRDTERAKYFAIKNNIKNYASDYDAVLKSNDYDFVYVATPNSTHYEYAKKALLNGKNVIVEKPFATNQKQTAELISLALSKKLFIFENMRTYHQQAFKSLKTDIDLIKPLRFVNMNYSKYSSAYDNFKANRPQTRFSLKHSSGALMDLGCYNISFAVGLFGLPLFTSYICNKKDDIDISGVSTLRYKDFIVNCISCKDSNSKNFVDIAGENGYIHYDEDPSTIVGYTIYLNNGKVKTVEYKEAFPFSFALKDMKDIYEFNNQYKYEQYLKLSLMEMKVLDDLRKSASIKFEDE